MEFNKKEKIVRMQKDIYLKSIYFRKTYFEIVVANDIQPMDLIIYDNKKVIRRIKGYKKFEEIRYRVFFSAFMSEIIKNTKIFEFSLESKKGIFKLKYKNQHQEINHFSNKKELYQYWNVFGIDYLRLKIKPAKIIRNISEVDVEGKIVKLTCDAGITYNEQTDFSILLIERCTGKRIYLPTKHTKAKSPFTVLYSNKTTKYRNTERKIELDFSKYALKNGLYDFFVEAKKNKGYVYRKLGFVDYIYKKDRVIATINDKSKTYYLTLTPRGNLKIEVNTPLKENHRMNTKAMNALPVWLIGERPDTAQDTGFAFFEFLMKNKLDEVNPFYVIERGVEDEKNLASYNENYVYKNSEEHYELALKASAFLGSHDLDYILPFKINKNLSAARFFLQHGVMGRKPAEYHKKFYDYPFHGVTVSSYEEKNLLEKTFGYDNKEVFVTGLSRFDKLPLHQEIKQKKILVMPTWREWINPLTKFENTDYFIRWTSLLNNDDFISKCRKNNVEILFYPHYRMQPYLDIFKKNINPYIEVVELGQINVQQLLIDSSLCVTDYSTVTHDMTFMSKPNIFYHFDFDLFFKDGILRKKEDTFLGDIAYSETLIINLISKYIEQDFKESNFVRANKKLILEYIDHDNSERIYNIVAKLNSRQFKDKNIHLPKEINIKLRRKLRKSIIFSYIFNLRKYML